MEHKHTPGPFEVFREKSNQGVSYYIRKVGNGIVGEAFWNCLTKNEETAAANAALFAAAPDLLEALQRVAFCNEVGFLPDDVQNSVATAIAKATGEQE